MTSYSHKPETYAAKELNVMTIAEIKALAASLGYSITATKKADIVTEFLSQQEVLHDN